MESAPLQGDGGDQGKSGAECSAPRNDATPYSVSRERATTELQCIGRQLIAPTGLACSPMAIAQMARRSWRSQIAIARMRFGVESRVGLEAAGYGEPVKIAIRGTPSR
jgi:hypothetical protein